MASGGSSLDEKIASTAIGTSSAVTTTGSLTAAVGYISTQLAPEESFFMYMLVTSGAAFTDTTVVAGWGLTWTKVQSVVSGNDYAAVFEGHGTPTSGTGTITFSRTPTAGRYGLIGVRGCDNSASAIAASAQTSGTGTSGSVALTASGLGQKRVSFWMHKAAESTTPDSTGYTWTEYKDATTTYGMEIQHLDGKDDTNTASWATSSFYFGVVIQFKVAVGTLKSFTITPYPMKALGIAIIEDDEPVWALV